MQNRYKLAVLTAALAGLWCTTPMAADVVDKVTSTVTKTGERLSAIGGGTNPPNQGSSWQGQSGSGVTPRTTGGSAAPYQSAPMPKFLSKRTTTTTTTTSAAPAPADTTMSAAPSSNYTPSTVVADSATKRMPRRDRN